MQTDPGTERLLEDSDRYSVVLENERVRVLEYRDQPGQKTEIHHHLDFLLVALSAFRRELTSADGTKRTQLFEPGDVLWLSAPSHVGENVGETEAHAMIVELKEPAPRVH